MARIAAEEDEQDAAQRLTLTCAGCAIAFVEYYRFGRVAIVTHTEVDPAFEGRGHGSEMVRRALDHFRSRDWRVVPVCGFFAEQIRRQPACLDLVTPECRRIFGL